MISILKMSRHPRVRENGAKGTRVRQRESSGLLSTSNISTIRCPTRVDFLNAFSGHERNGLRSRRLRTSRVTGEGGLVADEDSDEEGVPAYLNSVVLDATDRLEDCQELRAIVMWLDDVRSRNGFRLRITDKVLSNGIAFLDAMYIINKGMFEEGEEYVIRELDEEGNAANQNIEKLRRVLQEYPWQEGEEDADLTIPNFHDIDVWGLAGYVLLAAVTCEKSEDLIGLMMEYEPLIQERLSDVVARGMETLGVSSGLADEKRRRIAAEDEVERLKGVVDGWRNTCKSLEETVETLTRRVEETRAELHRVKHGGMERSDCT